MQYPLSVVLVASLAVVVLLVFPFLAYHIYLICINQTTNERFKLHRLGTSVCDSASKNRGQSLESVGRFYDQGLVKNFMEVLFPVVGLRGPALSRKEEGVCVNRFSRSEEVETS